MLGGFSGLAQGFRYVTYMREVVWISAWADGGGDSDELKSNYSPIGDWFYHKYSQLSIF